MTIDEALAAVKQFQDFAAKYHQRRGVEPTLEEWKEALESGAMRVALSEVKLIAGDMLADDFTREYGERILGEINAAV